MTYINVPFIIFGIFDTCNGFQKELIPCNLCFEFTKILFDFNAAINRKIFLHLLNFMNNLPL